MSKTGLVWFRNNLRVHDNTSLHRAVSENEKVVGLFCFDPRSFKKDRFGFKKMEKYRAKFLIETVTDLKRNLNKLNISLFIYKNTPEEILPLLIKDYTITSIYFQKEWTSEEIKVVQNVKKIEVCKHLNWISSFDQFLFHPEDIPFTVENIPQVFANFRKKCEKYAPVRYECNISTLTLENRIDDEQHAPTLQELGFESFEVDSRTAFPFEGGENEALKRIEEYFWNTHKLSYYKKTRNGLIGKNYSSKLSAWLANGSISPRTIYHEVKRYEQEILKNDDTYWLIFELIWRDFFKYISLKHGNTIFRTKGILNKEYTWSTDQNLIYDWINGMTHEPFVNANMLELKHTGWMSNRGRQNVASFFAKEQKLDWRIGAAYFESLLMDYDVHSNYGNWLYVSGVGNDPRDRKFNIKLQSERYDPNQKYQTIWLQPTLF
ncbi:DASH family cryptochrome [Aquimarina sp. 2201CG1-2-11]|uniref:DASH family cryptochrome n=1 Tax=Aquimarina discodermiae TaxID=3231043 RepID=UPI003462FFC5